MVHRKPINQSWIFRVVRVIKSLQDYPVTAISVDEKWRLNHFYDDDHNDCVSELRRKLREVLIIDHVACSDS